MITDIFYKQLSKLAPKCVHYGKQDSCLKYASKKCSYWYEELFGIYQKSQIISDYQLCDNCDPPENKAYYRNYRVFDNVEWKEAIEALRQYERDFS